MSFDPARLAQLHIAVIGDVMLDHYIWGTAHRISPEAPVPVVNIDRETYTAGGAANVALNLAALGVKVTLMGCVGEDEHAERLCEVLTKRHVPLVAMGNSADVRTIEKTRVVVQKQQLCRIDREDAPTAYALTPTDHAQIEARIADFDAVIVSDYAKGVVTQPTLDFLTGLRKHHNFLLALDPKPKRRLTLHGVDLLTPNRAESLQLAGIELGVHDSFPAAEVCDAITKRHGPARLVITLGADGMLLCESGAILGRMPTVARDVYDVSGAGDTVIAALVSMLASGSTLPHAAEIANIAAGIVVGKVGTATVTSEEILHQCNTSKESAELITL